MKAYYTVFDIFHKISVSGQCLLVLEQHWRTKMRGAASPEILTANGLKYMDMDNNENGHELQYKWTEALHKDAM